MEHQTSVADEIVYEVECRVAPDAVADFDAWLPGHVRQVMRSPGFLHAETLRPAEPAADGSTLRINRYRVATRAAIDHYLEQMAPALRADGAERFGERVVYVRRVLASASTCLPGAGARTRCANCAARLYGHYCAQCGQHAHESARSLGTLLHDAWHVFTHIDGRFWQTLRRLAFSPGHLTREYFAERRARYIPPFRLYIVISLIFFGLASLTSLFESEALVQVDASSDAPAVSVNDNAAPAAGGTPGNANPLDRASADASYCDRSQIQPAWLDHLIGPGVRATCAKARQDGGRSLAHAVGSNIPKMMFVFLPLMAGVMLLLYWSPRRYYVEHLVFYLHVHAALFLLSTLVIVLGIIGNLLPRLGSMGGFAGVAALGYATWYLWRAMRVYYGNGRALTFLKACLIFAAYVISLSLTLVGTAVVSLLSA